MTEQEWLECADPTPMLEFLQGKVSYRRLRLFSVACCKQDCRIFESETKNLQFAEEYADVLATDGGYETDQEANYAIANAVAVANACAAARSRANHSAPDAAHASRLAISAAISSYLDSGGHRAACEAEANALSDQFGTGDRSVQTMLLRCVMGNPFRPVTVYPAWLTSTVVSLATAIYDERAFDRLPILADALEDAGCDNTDILNHCRQPGVHVRGCWCVDLVLGKS